VRCRLLPTAVSALVALVLGACGGSGGSSISHSSGSSNGLALKSPDQIVSAATSAVAGAASVHVSGSVLSSGQHLALDLNLVSGKGGKGSMTQNGRGFQIVTIGPELYINGGSAFWRTFGGSAAAQLLSGKWLKAPASGQLSSLATLTDVRKLFTQLLANHGRLAKGKSATVRGRQAIAVHDTTNGGTLYVATTGKAYPIEIVKTGSQGGQIVFDHFNQPVSLRAPTGAIELSQLK
jgi:hypothetical protein